MLQKLKLKIKNFACREFKRTVAKTYPENWQMYVVANPNMKIRTTYQKFKTKDHLVKMQNKALETYNEFDL